MADIAGFAASILGITTFGVQTGKALLELKAVVESIKDAPEDVKELIKELTHLQDVLLSIQTQQTQFSPHALSLPIWDESLRRCQAASTDLETITGDLQKHIHRSKLRGSIKTVFRKELIAKYQNRLACAKTTLLLAQSTFITSVQFLQFAQSPKIDAILQQVHRLSQFQSVPAQSQCGCGNPETHVQADRPQDRFQVQRGMQRRYCCSHGVTIRSNWMKKLYSIHLRVAYAKLGLEITQWRIRPDDSEVFRVVREGNIHALQRMLDQHQASLYDVNRFGDNLLEVRYLSHQYVYTNYDRLLWTNGLQVDTCLCLNVWQTCASLRQTTCSSYYGDYSAVTTKAKTLL